MITTEMIQAATTGRFHVEFSEITLSRKGAQKDLNPIKGKGYVAQNGDTFEFVFFANDKAPPTPTYFMAQFMQTGNLIKDEAFFTAHCIEIDGTHWTIDDILPGANSGPSGYTIHAKVRSARWEESLPTDLKGNHYGATLFFLGKHDFMANEIVKNEKSVGNDQLSTSWSFSAAVVKDVPNIQIRIVQYEAFITLEAWSDQPLLQTFQLAAWQALEFSLAQALVCVLVCERNNAAFSGTVRPWADPRDQPDCGPPIAPNYSHTQDSYWALFSKVLTYLMRTDADSETLASCISDIISVGNSLLGAQALVRSIAVESLCNVIPKISSKKEDLAAEDRKKLFTHLDSGEYAEKFVKRIKDFLDNMNKIRVIDTADSSLKCNFN